MKSRKTKPLAFRVAYTPSNLATRLFRRVAIAVRDTARGTTKAVVDTARGIEAGIRAGVR